MAHETEQPSREECIALLVGVAQDNPSRSVTRHLFRTVTGHPDSLWTRHFETFEEFRRAAGLDSRSLVQSGRDAAPPIPGIGQPPEGMIVTGNNAEYDAQGDLKRQWVRTAIQPGEEFAVPPGHVVKGVSALLDPQGREMAKWVKTREGGGGDALIEALKEHFAAYRGLGQIGPAPAVADDTTMTVYPLADLHLGMYAWGQETGEDYDIETAVRVATEGISALVAQSRPSRRAVLLGLGDYFHANGSKPLTPTSGHILDVDSRWPKVCKAGARLATTLVEAIAQKHEEVEVVFLPGNHDLDAAVALTVALSLLYDGHPRIQVNERPGLHWYRRFGKVLLGATHGHTLKPEKMAMMLAADRPEDWGATRHRHVFFGHIHHETMKEVGPVRVESFGTPAAKDAFAYDGGYRSNRALVALTFHEEHGELGRHRVSIVAPGMG